MRDTWLGHPKGLFLLFATEMWERFSYYRMRALLVLSLIASVEDANAGFGWSQADAHRLYGLFTGFVYFTPLIGGWLADNYGPANGGVTDANAKYVTVEQTTTRPVPLALDTLQVGLDNHVHVRLDWTAVPAATAFRVYRSSSPVPGSFALLGIAAGTTYEDLAQGLDPETRFYLVRGVNACGQEGP